jgi:VanZ family protein
MPDMTLRTLFRCAAWLLLIVIAFVTLSPIELRPNTEGPPDFEQFAAVAAVGGAFCLGYPKLGFRILVPVIAIIGLLEVAQAFVPSRHGTFENSVVKASGALFGVALAVLINRRR